MVRYADDFVIGFEHRKVAERFLEQLPGDAARVRAGTASGKDAPDTVRAVCRRGIDSGMGKGKPETFNFLGFTHACGTIHQDGQFTVFARKTSASDGESLEKNEGGTRKDGCTEPIKDTGDGYAP